MFVYLIVSFDVGKGINLDYVAKFGYSNFIVNVYILSVLNIYLFYLTKIAHLNESFFVSKRMCYDTDTN